MSREGQSAPGTRLRAAVFGVTFPMTAGSVFEWHSHADHQLAWAARDVLTVRTGSATWMLPPARALWIPAGLDSTIMHSAAVIG